MNGNHVITILDSNLMGGEIINHQLTQVDREASVLEACKLMRKAGTTELLVTDKGSGMLRPLGILTANDIVKRVIAAELDPAVLTTGDIALSGIIATASTDSDAESLRSTQRNNCEALAVMDSDGRLVGTVRLEEVIGRLSLHTGTDLRSRGD